MDLLIQRKEQINKNLYILQKNILDLMIEKSAIECSIEKLSLDITYNEDIVALNKVQNEIVESESNNILVIACPGSGKTHTIISRYINLIIKKNIDPNHIILITFTNKSGLEMKTRINNLLPNKSPFYVGSLHGLCYKILQDYNLKSVVLDEKDSILLLKECTDTILENNNFNNDIIKNSIISIYEKYTSIYPLNLNNVMEKMGISKIYRPIITNIIKEYNNKKKTENLVDFNDLIIQFCTLLKNNKLTYNFKYIFFDEYQDINSIQFYILTKIKEQVNANLMVVGDDMQSIYSFRGSDVNYIWNHKNIFNDVSIYYLETNYRSTPNIVNLFQNIIKDSPNSIKKNVVTNNLFGVQPIIAVFNTKKLQAEWIAQDILKKYNSGVKYKDIAILARNNYSLNEIEYTLLKYSIPITLNNSFSILNKPHIKDLFAFLIVIINPLSTIHWKRIYLLHDLEYIQPHVETTLYIYYNSIVKLYKKNNIFTKEILISIQQYLIEIWKNNKNINILECTEDLNHIIIYLINNSATDTINSLYLQTPIEMESIDDTVLLSTIHSSKGLEWKHVYIIDLSSKDFPNIKNAFYMEQFELYEEERRLLYVAASRAKESLTISSYVELECNNKIMISPLIKTLDKNLYIESNFTLSSPYNLTGNVNEDINNYIQYNGVSKLYPLIKSLEHNRDRLLTDEIGHTIAMSYTVSNFLNILIYKMILNKFDSNNPIILLNKKIPDSIYSNYIDRLVDWRNILHEIFYIAIYNNKIDNDAKVFLLSLNSMRYYEKLEKTLIKKITSIKPNKITQALNLTNDKNKGEIKSHVNILVENSSNAYLIELKTSTKDACTINTICQTLLKSFLTKTIITDIIIFNPSNCVLDNFKINNNNIFSQIKKIIYYMEENA
jgi:DNA helicase-2/ATP-dependent DNA helicase PcrA